jgi:hypothetical protein
MSQSVSLGVEPHLDYCLTVTVLFFVGRPLWREDGSVVYNYRWCSPAQSFWGLSPVGLATIFYCLRFESPPTTRKVTVDVFDAASTQESLTIYLAPWLPPWLSESRTELTLWGPNIEHPVGELIFLLFSVATNVWQSPGNAFQLKCVSTSRCLATDVSAVLFWLHTSSVQTSYQNNFVFKVSVRMCQKRLTSAYDFVLFTYALNEVTTLQMMQCGAVRNNHYYPT